MPLQLPLLLPSPPLPQHLLSPRHVGGGTGARSLFLPAFRLRNMNTPTLLCTRARPLGRCADVTPRGRPHGCRLSCGLQTAHAPVHGLPSDPFLVTVPAPNSTLTRTPQSTPLYLRSRLLPLAIRLLLSQTWAGLQPTPRQGGVLRGTVAQWMFTHTWASTVNRWRVPFL